MAKRERITASDIGEACGFAFHPVACKQCGGCGWFSGIGPSTPCECNPGRLSVDGCFARLEEAKRKYNEEKYPELFGRRALRT